MTRRIAWVLGAALLMTGWAVAGDETKIKTVRLIPLGPVTTWTDAHAYGKDLARNPYAEEYLKSFSYAWAQVELSYHVHHGSTFAGTLIASGLKPNFAYQMKLTGRPTKASNPPANDWSNEMIGKLGRWWRAKPKPGNSNDADFDAHHNDPEYIFHGYLLFDYLVTDSQGKAKKEFALDGSFHVLWKTSQRKPRPRDGPVREYQVKAPIASPAYDQDYPEKSEGVFAEWEPGRGLPGKVVLPPGRYLLQFILTEESWHDISPGWAAALGCPVIEFTIGGEK